MTLRSAPQSAPRAVPPKYLENARFAVSLGAAFALLCAVVLEPQESSAAGGFLDLLFGVFSPQQVAPVYNYNTDIGYGPGRHYSPRRHARRSRAHYAQGRRHGIERRSYAERRAAERRAERYQRRIAEIRASEKRRLAARRANEARYAEAQNGWREIAANVEAEQFNKPDAVKRAETTQIAAPAAGSGPAAASPQVAAPQSTAKRAANGQYVPRAIVKPVDPAAAKPNEQPAIKPAEQDNKLAEKTAEPPLPPVIDRGSGERPSAPVEIAAPAADSSVGGSIVSRRPICVRACDGFYFPIANRESEVSAQQSCEKLCPGAQTAVFLMPGGSTRIEEAVSARGGETYAQFVARLRPEDARSKSCACPSTVMGSLPETSAFLSDLTLRPGDTIVTPQGMRVVRRGSHYPFKKSDFLSLAETRNISAATRGALAAIEKAMKTPHGRLAVASNSDRRRHRNDL